jgi:O-acetyl-ADP-ribose deacetylase (regulator of RNase III)
MTVTYLKGDATRPVGEGRKIIVHCCNDQGGWGSGFVLALSSRWRAPEDAYRKWHRDGVTQLGSKFELGAVQMVLVEPEIEVANLIGQHRYGKSFDPNDPFVRYDAIRVGLTQIAEFARQHGASIHMPRIGCGLAGGDWWTMGPIIEESLEGLPVFVYDLPE